MAQNHNSVGPTQLPLRIVHCFRSPVGGIFRHVRDLIGEQIAGGHQVGIICDNNTGGDYEEQMFAGLEPRLSLGLHRFHMHRSIGFSDIGTVRHVYRSLAQMKPDIVHSHGAKGGAYARIASAKLGREGKAPAVLYCPHGGSMHYDPKNLKGKVFFGLERYLQRWTERLVFVSNYERRNYIDNVGQPTCPQSLVYNGLSDAEFEPVIENLDATDFLYIGMMRDLKGVDLFIKALIDASSVIGRPLSAHLVGAGPDAEKYRTMVAEAGSLIQASFHEPMPARQAFAMAQNIVVPSRAESMPYIVLEAVAAHRPLIATNVGGIPEIYEGREGELVQPDSTDALRDAMVVRLADPVSPQETKSFATDLHERFSLAAMGQSVMKSYESSLNAHSETPGH